MVPTGMYKSRAEFHVQTLETYINPFRECRYPPKTPYLPYRVCSCLRGGVDIHTLQLADHFRFLVTVTV